MLAWKESSYYEFVQTQEWFMSQFPLFPHFHWNFSPRFTVSCKTKSLYFKALLETKGCISSSHVPFTSLHLSCAKRKNDVVYRGAIDLLGLFQYKTIHFTTGVNLHIIALKLNGVMCFDCTKAQMIMLAMHLNPPVAGSCSWPILKYCIGIRWLMSCFLYQNFGIFISCSSCHFIRQIWYNMEPEVAV